MQTPEASVAIVRTREPDPAILLMRRAEREGDAWSGHWSLPGGRGDPSDSDPLETALRELREECGIRLSPGRMSAALPLAIARRSVPPFLLVAPFVFDVDSQLPAVLDPREAVEAVWLPQRVLLDPHRHSFQPAPGLPAELRFPAIALPAAPLWGFTYRLLMDWLQVAPRDSATAGFDIARMALDFLLSQGLPLRRGWRSTAPSGGGENLPVHTAEIGGSIPAEALLERLSASGLDVAKANRIELRPRSLRIHGLAYEEYVIQAFAD